MFEVRLIPRIFGQPDESKCSNSPQGARCKILGFRLGAWVGGLVLVWFWGGGCFGVSFVLFFVLVWIFFLNFLRGEGGASFTKAFPITPDCPHFSRLSRELRRAPTIPRDCALPGFQRRRGPASGDRAPSARAGAWAARTVARPGRS